jgi:hypothetical protein
MSAPKGETEEKSNEREMVAVGGTGLRRERLREQRGRAIDGRSE